MTSRIFSEGLMKRLVRHGIVLKISFVNAHIMVFLELHQIDTFYNALTQSDQDSLNAATGGNLFNRTPRYALTIIENKSKVRTSRNKPVVSKMSATTTSSTPAYLLEITALTNAVKAMLSVKS
ncbi:hypothetical protein Tco_0816101 [Tanacetum coccineum]